MNTKQKEKQTLPDIAQTQQSPIKKTINKVGMSNIQCPILWPDNNQLQQVIATCSLQINLNDPAVKGIHMSRLYDILLKQTKTTPLTMDHLNQLLATTLLSHDTYSNQAFISLAFDYQMTQPSLTTSNYGYRYYPITLNASRSLKSFQCDLSFTITYSSTCPCSAALSRQAIAEKFNQEFNSNPNPTKKDIQDWLNQEQSLSATPHAQRSKATITLSFLQPTTLSLTTLIQEAEQTIQTAVQTIVKRSDEKAFAVKNAKNLMFAEDAVRKLSQWVDSLTSTTGYNITVTHFESLHAHNATATIEKPIN